MLSAWIAERGQHCTIKIGFWEENGHDEAKAWGVFLADTVRHIANGLQEKHGKLAPETTAAIIASFHQELGKPSSEATGSFSDGHH